MAKDTFRLDYYNVHPNDIYTAEERRFKSSEQVEGNIDEIVKKLSEDTRVLIAKPNRDGIFTYAIDLTNGREHELNLDDEHHPWVPDGSMNLKGQLSRLGGIGYYAPNIDIFTEYRIGNRCRQYVHCPKGTQKVVVIFGNIEIKRMGFLRIRLELV